jgi:hypothetical protein
MSVLFVFAAGDMNPDCRGGFKAARATFGR